jgi:fatty acid desaturase
VQQSKVSAAECCSQRQGQERKPFIMLLLLLVLLLLALVLLALVLALVLPLVLVLVLVLVLMWGPQLVRLTVVHLLPSHQNHQFKRCCWKVVVRQSGMSHRLC